MSADDPGALRRNYFGKRLDVERAGRRSAEARGHVVGKVQPLGPLIPAQNDGLPIVIDSLIGAGWRCQENEALKRAFGQTGVLPQAGEGERGLAGDGYRT